MSIPPAKQPAVDRALMAAFGTTEVDSVATVSGGLSGALTYRIRVGGIAYLLRIETQRDGFKDPHRWYRCMAIAANGCLAPRVRHADPTDGVAIMEFIPEQSWALDYAGTRQDLIVEAAQAIRALHQTPAFPPLVDYMEGMDAVVAGFQATGLLAPEATCDLLDRGRRPDAFVVGDDYYALGLYRAFRERGMRVPDDVLVMGWGNHPFTRLMDPPLSTLLLPFEEVARRAVRRLLDRIQGIADSQVVTERIVPELVIRASTPR